MARIRSIKPEFPQSESMGRISRDARLLFIELWTIADDEGRLRGNSRMLASLLFPYDDDANLLIEGWLSELVNEGCIVRYSIDKDHYIQVCNWLIHQKIDKPTKSKIPAFDESSRILANPRESSSEDLRIKDQGSKDQGEDHGASQASASAREKRTELISVKTIRKEISDLEEQTVIDYLAVRKAKRAPLTRTAWDSIKEQILITQSRFGVPPNKSLSIAVLRNWQGFEADWIAKHLGIIGNETYQHAAGKLTIDHNDTSWAEGLEIPFNRRV